MKKLGIFTLVLTLSCSASLPSKADVQIPSAEKGETIWTTPVDSDMNQDYSRVWYTTEFSGGLYESVTPWVASGKSISAPSKICDALDSRCVSKETPTLQGTGLFELCSVSGVAPCIESVEFIEDAGGWTAAEIEKPLNLAASPEKVSEILADYDMSKYVKASQKTWGWPSNPQGNLPASATGPMPLYLKSRTHRGGSSSYILSASFKFAGQLSNLQFSDFQIAVRPLVRVACTSGRPNTAVLLALPGEPKQVEITGGGCFQPNLYVSGSEAGWAAGYAEKFPIRIKTRLPISMGGWFQGRVDEPSVSVRKFDSNSNLVIFEGLPTTVPVTSKQIPVEEPKSKPIIEATCKGCTDDLLKWQAKGGRGPTGRVWTSEYGVQPLTVWSKLLGTKARGERTLWSFSHFQSKRECMGNKSQLQGLVTTNAMVYQPDTPTFTNGELRYQVGGLHLTSSGEVFEGTYNFIMRSSVARCLYGFKGAAIGGKVTVTSNDGKPKVAVTSVGESDGWLRITASGFSFSSPVIRAKLTQSGHTNNKRTIVCVSLKNRTITKKVSGIYPSCPAGFTR